MSIKKDKYFISLANNIAQNTLGYTGPNPSVGTVIVKKNKILSFASTSATGRPHSEVNALNKISNKDKKNSTIYISLEPCTHYGKTSPCVNQIIKSNINRVVYSINDVDYRTSGKSYRILKSRKITVRRNILHKNSKSIYTKYFYTKKNNLPYVVGKLAISKDYFLKDKKKFYITNNLSLKTTHILRSRVNCILTSSNTINDDNPKLNCRIYGLNKFSPKIAILDKNLKIKKNSYLINNAKKNRTFLFYNKDNKSTIKYLKSKGVVVIKTPTFENNLDLKYILKKLYKFEISSIIVEAGKLLTLSLLNNNFLNEFYLFISSEKLNKRGTLKIKNIKTNLSKKFKNFKLDETFLDKDNLIHYY